MNAKLFEFGLNISGELDRKFNKKTIGAKMSDVPGHTISMVPLMRKHGIRFLHLGINVASPLPDVPPIFKWRFQDDEITVMYQSGYGEVFELADCIIYFAHTSDNVGPQTAQQIIDIYTSVKEAYPDCTVRAGTIDDIAEQIAKLEDLPVIDREIGDTWIHGIGSDPQKLSRYRKLLRQINQMDALPPDLAESLLCIPEHTWGMDSKRFFPYDQPYSHTEMEHIPTQRDPIERSWEEQRDYARKAEALLGVEPDYPVAKPNLKEYTQTELPKALDFEISWQIFDNTDFRRYEKEYLCCHLPHCIQNFTKVGLPDYKGGIYSPQVTKAYQKGTERLYILEFEEPAVTQYGLPYCFVTQQGGNISIQWFGKKRSRIPQACWFKLRGLEENWKIQKLGQWISPEEILDCPFICGIDEGVRNTSVTVKSLDCGLVAPFGRHLLRYNSDPYAQDLYFNLYNNVWNTNFPLWYADDALFRFVIVPD